MEIKHTRKDYMDRKVSHREYYGQFVTPTIFDMVCRYIGIKRIMASKDPENFNDIPLYLWDNLAGGYLQRDALKEAGDGPSLSSGVCILKEAARQLKETALLAKSIGIEI